MEVKRKYFEREEKRVLKSVNAIVIHWPAGRGIPKINLLWDWMNKYSENSYHYLVSKEKVIQSRDTRYRALHCGHRTYRKKAKDFFGSNVCSPVDSPNNYTIAVCMLHDLENGSYNSDTIDTAVNLLAHLCIDNSLNPDTDLWRHSDITNEKKTPCPKGFFEDDDDPDDLWNSFKNWIAARITELYNEIGIDSDQLIQKYDNIKQEK